MTTHNIWWEQVTNATRFVNDIVRSMIQNKSIIILSADKIPWHDFFIELIEDKVKKEDSVGSFDFLNEYSDKKIGEFLVDKYCKREKKNQYRPGKSSAEFLASSEEIVLNEKYVWVQNVNEVNQEEWINFVIEYSNYKKQSFLKGVFILELPYTNRLFKQCKNVTVISIDRYITHYDTLVFSMLFASNFNENEYIKQYLAELATCIGNDDAELCAKIVEREKVFLDNPIKTLKTIQEEEFTSNGYQFDSGFDENKINHFVWEAQIKLVFPIVEKYRKWFLEKYKNLIEPELPIKTLYGEVYEEVTDVELGTLKYIIEKKNIKVSKNDADNIILFANTRNILAHLKSLSLNQVEDLFLICSKYLD